MERSSRKSRPKIEITTYHSSELSSKKATREELFIPNRAFLKSVFFHLKPQGPVFCQLKVPRSRHQKFTSMFNDIVIVD